MKQFTLEFWKDEGWYVGRLLEVPGVFSQGETIEELKKNIQDAYRMVMDSEDVSFIPPTASRILLELAN
jgi:predicted RNase H-like HicB family nuclease